MQVHVLKVILSKLLNIFKCLIGIVHWIMLQTIVHNIYINYKYIYSMTILMLIKSISAAFNHLDIYSA